MQHAQYGQRSPLTIWASTLSLRRSPALGICLGTVLSLLLLETSQASAQPASVLPAQCFFVNQLESWRAPDDKTIYIRVLAQKYYRLNLSASCPEVNWPGAYLITRTQHGNAVCSSLDWELQIGTKLPERAQSCIVESMTLLTPADVAAIPARFKP